LLVHDGDAVHGVTTLVAGLRYGLFALKARVANPLVEETPDENLKVNWGMNLKVNWGINLKVNWGINLKVNWGIQAQMPQGASLSLSDPKANMNEMILAYNKKSESESGQYALLRRPPPPSYLSRGCSAAFACLYLHPRFIIGFTQALSSAARCNARTHRRRTSQRRPLEHAVMHAVRSTLHLSAYPDI
jgi:hypothetical protein